MKIEISEKERLMLISCLKPRLEECQNDTLFSYLYELDYSDWAEKFKDKKVINDADYIDNICRLLIKLGDKRSPRLFEDIIKTIKDLKDCKNCLLIGNSDDYYKISLIDKGFKVMTFELKKGVSIGDEFSLVWEQRDMDWVRSESNKALTKQLTKKEALFFIEKCDYKGSKPSDKMIRFLSVILK